MDTSDYVIETKNLNLWYGEKQALKDINIKIDSVDVEDSRVISILNLEIVHLNPELRGSVIHGDIKVWSEI